MVISHHHHPPPPPPPTTTKQASCNNLWVLYNWFLNCLLQLKSIKPLKEKHHLILLGVRIVLSFTISIWNFFSHTTYMPPSPRYKPPFINFPPKGCISPQDYNMSFTVFTKLPVQMWKWCFKCSLTTPKLDNCNKTNENRVCLNPKMKKNMPFQE